MNEDNTPEVLRRLMDECIRPNALEISKIISTGEIALLVYRPAAKWRALLGLLPDVVAAVRAMPAATRRDLINNGDSVTSRWCKGGRTGRMFAVVDAGTLLLNFVNGEWSIEPGSLDEDAS